MKKILVALLLVTAVIGMSMPGMANPQANIFKTVNDAQTAANSATSSVDQRLTNSGAQSNDATVLALGGSGDANSLADARGSATNDGKAKVVDSGNGRAEAGNKDSGNADASSIAVGTGGDARNGNVYQKNKVIQDADATLSTEQGVNQGIFDLEIFVPIVHVDSSMFDNTVGNDNLVELDENGCCRQE